MVRALSHSKHEILPGSWMLNVNCTHFHFAVLVCHFLHLSDLPYTIYSERAATYLSQCSWMGTAVCWQIRQRFYNGTGCCNSSARADCSPTCSRPVGASADKLTHTYTRWHTDTHRHAQKRAKSLTYPSTAPAKPCQVLSITGARWERNTVHSSCNSVTGSVHPSVCEMVGRRLLHNYKVNEF